MKVKASARMSVGFAIGTTCLCASSAVLAQEEVNKGAVTLDPTLVRGVRGDETAAGFVGRHSSTGSRTSSSILTMPQSVNVVGQAQMSARGVQTMTEALSYLPGTHASTPAISSRSRRCGN